MGQTEQIHLEDEDMEITFMQKYKDLLQWQKNEDKLWINFSDVIYKMKEPIPTGKSKRMLKLS